MEYENVHNEAFRHPGLTVIKCNGKYNRKKEGRGTLMQKTNSGVYDCRFLGIEVE
jgi:hypothetical protein